MVQEELLERLACRELLRVCFNRSFHGCLTGQFEKRSEETRKKYRICPVAGRLVCAVAEQGLDPGVYTHRTPMACACVGGFLLLWVYSLIMAVPGLSLGLEALPKVRLHHAHRGICGNERVLFVRGLHTGSFQSKAELWLMIAVLRSLLRAYGFEIRHPPRWFHGP